MMADKGFTLVELVAVIVLLGILSAVAIPKFFSKSQYQERAAYDEIASALRYAQKLAVASGCNVRAQISTTGYGLQLSDSCSGVLSYSDLDDSHPITENSFTDISISPVTTISFDAMGRSLGATTISVGSRDITIDSETGYVDAP